MTTKAIVVGRKQAESIKDHLENALDHPLVESIWIITTDEEGVEESFSSIQGYHKGDEDLSPPPLDETFFGVVFVMAAAGKVEDLQREFKKWEEEKENEQIAHYEAQQEGRSEER